MTVNCNVNRRIKATWWHYIKETKLKLRTNLKIIVVFVCYICKYSRENIFCVSLVINLFDQLIDEQARCQPKHAEDGNNKLLYKVFIWSAASMVSEVSHSLGRVGFAWGVTSYLGRAWCVLELHGCYCMGACIKQHITLPPVISLIHFAIP